MSYPTPPKGHDWTDDQKSCIEALADFAGGFHHLSGVKPFGAGISINHHGDLSTYDGRALTNLVLVAHARAVRISIAPCGPKLIKILAHKRKHGDRKVLKFHEYHPGLPDLAFAAGELQGELLKEMEKGGAA